MDAEAVRFTECHRPRSSQRTAAATRHPGGNLIAPWIPRALEPASSRVLPFGLRGKAHQIAGFRSPAAECLRVVPAHARHWKISHAEAIGPLARSLMPRDAQELRVLRLRDRIHRTLERVHLHLVHRPFVFWAGLAAHKKGPGGKGHEVDHASL